MLGLVIIMAGLSFPSHSKRWHDPITRASAIKAMDKLPGFHEKCNFKIFQRLAAHYLNPKMPLL